MTRQTPATASPVAGDEQDDSRSSSTNSPAPADNEESDFFLGANDSQSSLGVPNFQDMVVDDTCWPPVNRLPNEILMATFAKLSAPSDLYHTMLVCKRWARNAVDLLWHRPACTNWKNHLSICQTLGVDRPFFSYRDFIKRLNLAAIADKVNDGSVSPLATCTRVERLTLTNCRGLTDSGLIALVENSASLLALDISNDRHITEQSIYAIADHCKRLQGLNISGCDSISNESMVTLAGSCKHLKRLKFNECRQLRDNAILAFAEHCPNILEIDLHQCNQIGNVPITSLLAKGNCLRELRLANCDLIDDHAFLALPQGQLFEHLRILDLTSCQRLTDAAVQKIISAAPRLRNLVLAKCRNITDTAVNAIASLGKNLHYVHLGHCGQITDEGVKKLVHSCNRIRYIDLGCCTNLTDESVKRLALLPKLKRIGLVKCGNITDESVFTLAEAAYRPKVRRDGNGLWVGGEYYASSLERVHLSYCINLTLKSIMRLLNSCPRLTHLSLTGVAAFQLDEFQPYCRSAPAEFTQHQRDVFCVFSGNMVSKFRDFLNAAPQFEELRQQMPRFHLPVRAAVRSRLPDRTLPAGGYFQVASDAEGFVVLDEEMADEENDYEAIDASEMALDGTNGTNGTVIHGQNPATPQHNPALPTFEQIQAQAEQAADNMIPGQPPINSFFEHHMTGQTAPLNYSSFITNDHDDGPPPLSAYGQAQANARTRASSASVAGPASGSANPSAGASTATFQNGGPTNQAAQPQDDQGQDH